MSHPRPFTACGSHRCPTAGALFLRGSNDLFTNPAINTRPFPVFGPHSYGFGNHFPEGQPSFHYLSPSTFNFGVTYGPSTEKRGSSDLFTIPAINSRHFSVFWPHSHGLGNHFMGGHPSFHYSSLSTINYGFRV
ncbi:unnamed protein product [Microthlaspi erraticum]|uniref:Uncharacterized protein n=1 Tax=Microthlaspi erraticum TaxID=1685480 RepID=A0A6D2INX2_9BRAS|nr:unnamed protein product [Microthlaspi erraticum]